ncbi:MAG: sulfurtransferase [Gammaproteobacteria bacterium]|nr:sulfurtransferase [Gammaproteobacteria bacterium]
MTSRTDLIDIESLQSLLSAGQCRLIDCRHDLFDRDKGYADYCAGHIPGAAFAHMDDDLASEISARSGRHPLPDADAFVASLRDWGINNDSFVVVYDAGNGSFASRLWWMLKFWFGHDQVAVLDGGISAWTAENGALETGIADIDPGTFSGSPNPAVVASTDEIATAVRSGHGLNLVDARDAGRFRGEVEPIDTVAGHVPGARNLPLSVSLDSDGRWREAAELERIWREFLADGPDVPPVVMCGSGVTACHLILSAHLAGLPAPRLYVGSWSEWIRDENRPVATENQAE